MAHTNTIGLPVGSLAALSIKSPTGMLTAFIMWALANSVGSRTSISMMLSGASSMTFLNDATVMVSPFGPISMAAWAAGLAAAAAALAGPPP